MWDEADSQYKLCDQEINGEAAGDTAGFKLSLSADGNTLAIGAREKETMVKSQSQARLGSNIGTKLV